MHKIKICRAPDCDKAVDWKQASRLCQMHRTRWSRHKSFDLPSVPGLPEGIVKICKIHGERTHQQAYKVPNSKCYNCRACRKISADKYKTEHPNRIAVRNYYYVKTGKIRITKIYYDQLLKEQDNLCKICNKPESLKHKNGKTKRLAIDHCHASEKNGLVKIRGLLCQYCNSGLGHFKDDPILLQKAIDYLKM